MTDKISSLPIDKAMADGSFNPKAIQYFMGAHGHSKALGLEYHGHGDNWMELRLPWNDKLIGDVENHILASGPIISMMDNATSMAIWTSLGYFRPQVTLDLRVDYMASAEPNIDIIGRGIAYHHSRNISFVRGIAWQKNMDKPIAHVSGTFIAIADFSGQTGNDGKAG